MRVHRSKAGELRRELNDARGHDVLVTRNQTDERTRTSVIIANAGFVL